MLDVVAFSGSRAGTVALNNLPGLADDHITVRGNDITVPARCSKILAVFAELQSTAGGVTALVALQSPLLRSTSILELSNILDNGAIVAATQIPGNDPPVNDYKEAPVELKPGEGLQALTSVSAAQAAETGFIVVFLTDGAVTMPLTGLDPTKPPRIETVHATGGAPAVAGAWTTTPLTFTQVLQAGTYAVVGMRAVSPSMTVARLIFSNQGERPGCLACNSPAGNWMGTNRDPMNGMFRYGRLGMWGTFSHINPPQVQVLCSLADAAANQHFILDVIKIGG